MRTRLAVILVLVFSALAMQAERSLRDSLNYRGYLFQLGGDNKHMITQSTDSAYHYFQLAAEAGSSVAMNNLSYYFHCGDTLRFEPQMRLSEMAIYGDNHDAVRYAEMGAERGNAQAQARLGEFYEDNGLREQAKTLYESAFERGLADAELRLLNLMGREWNELPDKDLLNLSIEYHNKRAYLIAGNLLRERIEHLESQSDTDIDAQVVGKMYALLGRLYSLGEGVNYNHEQSLRCLIRGAELDDPSALFMLSESLEFFPDLLKGRDSALAGQSAVELLERAAERGVQTAEQSAQRLRTPI